MRRVVLIDDDDFLRVVAATLLREHGWDVHEAATGSHGVQLVADEQPDLVLLDVVMPDPDGPATLRLLRADPRTRSVPVLFLTAASGRRESLIGGGAQGAIEKPFDPATLADEIEHCMGWA